ncbi:transcriptional regulator GcvA [Hyphomicrobium facile]|uniref:Transcriptional regulator, LysR family n=1 Tax=Hyphomicrobium facile TaxID=51670 RepID=A0A1I7MTJ1_9HYPH|nr:transcriptional regulator GcvA [Hyphomicrobium facile]SFV25718.1 transcriptional regulator, LysR family [Hyphomicrobium facile]
MARRLPPLNALKAFEAAARLSSFSRAAEELNVTHAAISRHIRTLESEFRTPLFERTGRGVVLTEAGQSLAQELTKGFDLIAAASSRFARPSRRRKRLVVTSDVSFAALWLVPRLGKFTELHPGIDIVLDPSHRLVDFAKEDVDIGIRFGGGEWSGVDVRKLADAGLMLVSSPKFLADNPLSAPADLDGALLIQETAKECWNAWLTAAGISGRVVPSGPTLNGDLALAAAEAGQGFALADQIQAGDALLAKRLVRPFHIVVSRQGYYLVSRAGAKTPDAAAVFETWLTAELRTFEATLAAYFAPAVFGTKRVRKPPIT